MASRSVSPAPALVLFDIDGTLLRRAGPHHRMVLIDAIQRVTGVQTSTDGIPVQGMLDPDILTRMMRRAGLSLERIRGYLPEITQKAQSLYARRCPDLTRKTTPGARALLQRLHTRGLPLGLVTGNLSRIGWKKMERAGLKQYFRYGAFAEQAKTRSALARLAIREARRQNWIDSASVVCLVGDHFNDVKAARENHIRSVAVATGLCPPEELAASEPDYLLHDLRDFRLRMIR